MDISLYIARRYLVSKKSNNVINLITWISIAAIAVTTAALVVILSAMNGLTSTVANLYNVFEPDIRILPATGKFIQEPGEVINKIKDVKYVEVISRSITDKALLKNGDKQALVTIKGIDNAFSRITRIDSAVVDGVFAVNDTTKKHILLGRGVAGQLHVNPTSFMNELWLFSPAKGKNVSFSSEDHLTQVPAIPSGIFSLNDELDFQFAFVSLKTAQELFAPDGRVSALELGCKKNKSSDVQEELKEILGDDYIVKNRYELNDVLFKSLETEKFATFIILAFILVIATFNIIGAITMLIIEKKKDIGTLYSLGADKSLIRNIFMREAFLICAIGAVIGLLTGLFVCWLQIRFHLVKFGSEFIIPYYPIELQPADFVRILLLILLMGFFAALYPVRVFTRADIVKL